MDLGTERKEGELAAPVAAQDGDGKSYPGFSLNDDKVREFLEEHPVTMGDVITFTGRAKVTGMSDQRYGTSLQFDLLNMDDCKKEEEGEGEHEGEHDETYEHPMANPAIGKMLRRKRDY